MRDYVPTTSPMPAGLLTALLAMALTGFGSHAAAADSSGRDRTSRTGATTSATEPLDWFHGGTTRPPSPAAKPSDPASPTSPAPAQCASSVVALPCTNAIPRPHGWETLNTDGLIGQVWAAASVIGDNIVLSHGYGAWNGETQIYDIAVDAWFEGAQASAPRHHVGGVCAIEDGAPLHFAIGGQRVGANRCTVVSGQNGNICGDVEAYDPSTDSWSPRAPLNHPRFALCTTYAPAVGPEGTIFAIGGLDADDMSPVNEAYDVGSGVWSFRSPMPHAMAHASCVWSPSTNLIYVFGGAPDDYGLPTYDFVQRYDPAADIWLTDGVPMPTARRGTIAGICGGDIYVIGDSDFDEFRGSVSENGHLNEGYDPVADRWETSCTDPINLPRAYGNMATHSVSTGSAIYMVGGGINTTGHTNFRYGCTP